MSAFTDVEDIFSEIEDHLRFATGIIDRPTVSPDLRAQLNHYIRDIESRRADPNLYLAVVGDFNTGKTTFINALLNDNLLKASAMPQTTAAATRLRYGELLSCMFSIRVDQDEYTVTAEDGVLTPLNWLPDVEPMPVRDLIRFITTTDEYARNITRLEINHPARFLGDQMVLIDLPGVNVPMDKKHHVRITREALAEADAAIVIIDGSQPLSQSLVDFLHKTASDSLHRCIYITTRLDYHPDPANRALVLKSVEDRIKDMLMVDDPRVFGCAAQAVIDQFSGEAPLVKTEREYWVAEFEALKERLYRIVRYERTVVIAEKLVGLLRELIAPLDEPLQAELRQHEAEWQAIEQNRIRNLTSFTYEQRKKAQNAVNAALESQGAKLAEELDDYLLALKVKIRSGIFNAANWDALDTYVKEGIERDLSSSQLTIADLLETYTQKIQNVARNAAKVVDQDFQDAYERIPGASLTLGKDAETTLAFERDSAQMLASTQALQAQLEAKSGSSVRNFAIAGAVFGTAIPVIGTFFGAVAGGALGLVIGRGSMTDRKNALWDALVPKLDEAIAEIKTKTAAMLEDYANALNDTLTDGIAEHRQRYTLVVDDLIAKHKARRESLNLAKIQVEQELAELNHRLRLLSDYWDSLRRERYIGD